IVTVAPATMPPGPNANASPLTCTSSPGSPSPSPGSPSPSPGSPSPSPGSPSPGSPSPSPDSPSVSVSVSEVGGSSLVQASSARGTSNSNDRFSRNSESIGRSYRYSPPLESPRLPERPTVANLPQEPFARPIAAVSKKQASSPHDRSAACYRRLRGARETRRDLDLSH